jgi:lipopolysaccharide biosynthesis protein
MRDVAVCLYLYHTDLWPEFKQLLLPLAEYIRLYIGLCKDNHNNINDFADFDYRVSFHQNYGADVAPFLNQLKSIEEPVFIKLHSKKSYWGFKGRINWRTMLLNDLIGSKEIFLANLQKLLNTKNAGLLSNKVLLMGNREYKNRNKIIEICAKIGIDYNTVKNSKFPAGNMFMGKTKIFEQHISKNIDTILDLLYNETGKVDDRKKGTYSHAMERIFGYVNTYQNLDFIHADHKIVKINNPKAPNKQYFSMVHTYNNDCYLLEDPNIYGYYDIQNSTITWYHLENITKQKYRIIDNYSIEKE